MIFATNRSKVILNEFYSIQRADLLPHCSDVHLHTRLGLRAVLYNKEKGSLPGNRYNAQFE